MKIGLSWPGSLCPALALIACAGLSSAQSLTETRVEKAQAIVERALEAHGGADALDAIDTLIVEHATKIHAVGQSRGTEAPWDVNQNTGMDAIDLGEAVFVTVTAGEGGGFEFNNATIIDGDDSYQVDYRTGTATPIAEPDFDTASGPFVRVTPPLLLKQVRDRRQSAVYLGEESRGGRTFDVVTFSMAVGPAISLLFDRDSGMLHHSERVLPGFGTVGYTFSDYETIDGVAMNREFTLHLNGDVNMERDIVSIVVNEPLDELAAVSAKLEKTEALAPDPVTRREVADGIWQIGGAGTYAMFVELDDHVVAVGATAGIPERIALLREVVPTKPIRYGVLTHHHSDHVLGVPAYVAEDATVVAARAHEAVVRQAGGEDARLELVSEKVTLGTDERPVEVIDIGPTPHTEHLLVTWLPNERILFEADHFAMPRTGPVPPAVESTASFHEALTKHGLKPALIVSAHSPVPGTPEALAEALAKKPVKL